MIFHAKLVNACRLGKKVTVRVGDLEQDFLVRRVDLSNSTFRLQAHRVTLTRCVVRQKPIPPPSRGSNIKNGVRP